MENFDTVELTTAMPSVEEVKVGNSLQDHVQSVVAKYFDTLTDDSPRNLYDIALAELELPLLTEVMKRTKGNQSKAAILLGLSRGTLRKKLKIYGFID
jgi:Fis family transcriptional regulator